MKKALLFLSALVVSMCSVACGGSKQDTATNTTPPVAMTTQVEETTEKQYNELLYESDNLKITFYGVHRSSSGDVWFDYMVENFTDQPIEMKMMDLKVDGFSLTCIDSPSVSENSKEVLSYCVEQYYFEEARITEFDEFTFEMVGSNPYDHGLELYDNFCVLTLKLDTPLAVGSE